MRPTSPYIRTLLIFSSVSTYAYYIMKDHFFGIEFTMKGENSI